MNKPVVGIRAAALLALCVALVLAAAPARLSVAQVATAAPTQAAASTDGVATITGSVTVTSPFALEDSAEPFLALIDLTAFVKRDRDAKLPFSDQTIAGLTGDISKGARFTMSLPIQPRGALNNLSNGKGGTGVMVFAVDYDTNAIGDAFMGPYEWTGWPGGLDSLQFDPGTYEVSAGHMLVWSPDDNQFFPTGYGSDTKLFTADDPTGPIGRGWTVVNLDKTPFEQIRTRTVEVPILEGLSANNDLSALSYTAAFDALVKDLRVRYTFTEYKKIDWDALVRDIRPLIVQAEQAKDKDGFSIAMGRFVARFKDGHVYVDTPADYLTAQTAGGIGLVLSQADDGQVIARLVLDALPSAAAGIKVGALITQWNGQPINTALDATELLFTPQSSPISSRLQQLRYIMRAPVGTKYSITFQNPGEAAKTVTVTSVAERQSFSLSSTRTLGPTTAPEELPITLKLLPSGYGYIKISTFSGDSILMTRSWEYAIQKMTQLQAKGIIVDMRSNGGGSGLLADHFAASFTQESFVLNETYAADKSGKFLYVGKSVIDPAPVQWEGPVAVLVGPSCASACEIFSAAVAHDPKHLIVGRYPSAGVEAGVEPWTLPDGLYFQAPVFQIRYPDGRIFLEGTGVVPNVKIPVTVQTLLAGKEDDIAAAERALDAQAGIVATPAATVAPVRTVVATAAATSPATSAATAAATTPVTAVATSVATAAVTAAPTSVATAAPTLPATIAVTLPATVRATVAATLPATATP